MLRLQDDSVFQKLAALPDSWRSETPKLWLARLETGWGELPLLFRPVDVRESPCDTSK